MTDCSPRRAFDTEGDGSNGGASFHDGTDAIVPPVDDGIVLPPAIHVEPSPSSIVSIETPSVRAEGGDGQTPVLREDAGERTAEVPTDRNRGNAGDASADGAKSAGTTNDDEHDPSTTATKSSSPEPAAELTSSRLSPRPPPVPEAGEHDGSSSSVAVADDDDDDHGGLVLNVDLAFPPPMPGGPLPSIAPVRRRTSASSSSGRRGNEGDGGSGVVLPGAHAVSVATDGGNASADASDDAFDDEGIHDTDEEDSQHQSGHASALPAVSVATLVQDGVVVDAAAVDLEAEAAERDRLRREIEALEREEKDRDGHSWQRRRPFWVALGAVAVVAAIVAASVAAGILVPRGRGGEAGDESSSKEETTRYEDLRTIVAPLGREADNDTFDDVDSPRSKALDWIARIDPLRLPLDDPDREWKVRQRYVMALLYFSTGGEDWDMGANFVTDQDECRWFEIIDGFRENEFFPFGVRCDDQGRISAINISWNNMSGTIPPELSYLADSLTDLSLPGGGLSGTIPPELGKLTELKMMLLTENCLSGDVPESLFALSNLEMATFSGNRDLTGSLNGFCDGNEYKGNLSHMQASCDTCPNSPALVQCDCCICCDIVTYNCCDRQGNRLFNHANIGLNAAGQPSSFDKPCVAEETRTYYDANKDDLSWITDGRGNNFL